MILWDKVKKSFDSGTEVLRRVAVSVSERASIESAVARSLIDKGSMESRLDRQYQELGECVFMLWDQGDENVMGDRRVGEALRDIAATNDQMHELNDKIRKASLGEKEG